METTVLESERTCRGWTMKEDTTRGATPPHLLCHHEEHALLGGQGELVFYPRLQFLCVALHIEPLLRARVRAGCCACSLPQEPGDTVLSPSLPESSQDEPIENRYGMTHPRVNGYYHFVLCQNLTHL